MPKVIFLDAGHGGINPATGMYTTAPSKMFKHKDGSFHEGSTFYEGVKNREVCGLLRWKLAKRGITVIPVYHDYIDTPLEVRIEIANYYHKNVQQGIYVSEHSNATDEHTARGLQVYTTPGQNQSDTYAETLIEMFERTEVAPGAKIKVLTNTSDGDKDYEARFKVLMETDMPAIMIENLFFDNFRDAEILNSVQYQQGYTDIIANWIEYITK